MFRDLMSNTTQERGYEGSQVTRKFTHCRQLGALSGFVGMTGILSAILESGKSAERR